MQNRLFRKESIDRVTSPEQLQDYMQVTGPSVWMLMAAIIALLTGLLVLASVNTLETTLAVEAQVTDGEATVAIPSSFAGMVDEGMTLRAAGQETAIETVYENDAGEIYCTARLSARDGRYDATLVTEVIAPIQFLLN